MTRRMAIAALERRHRDAIALGKKLVLAARRQLELARQELRP